MRGLLIATYVANLFLSFHYFIPAYIISAYLSLYVSERSIGFLYALASLVTLSLFIYSGRLLARYGNTRLFVTYALLDLLSVSLLAFSPREGAVLLGFLGHQALAPLILFSLDLYLERATTKEGSTGTIRGTYLTVSNATLVISPLIAGFLIEAYGTRAVFGASLLFLLPVFALGAGTFRKFNDHLHESPKLKEAIIEALQNPRLTAVFSVNFLLQLFYSWMVIYAPLLLRSFGLSWTEVGLVFSIMLIPFLLFELPVGALADARVDEKKIVIAGLLILGIFTLLFGLSPSYSFVWFASVLFMTRVGAAFVEAGTESYFFKQVDGGDAPLVALFRSGRALSYIAGPIAGTMLLHIFSVQSLFIILGIFALFGILLAKPMKRLVLRERGV